MDRTKERQEDLINSVYIVCSGDSVEAEKLIHSPISVYEAKIAYFVHSHKSEKDNAPKPITTPLKRIKK